MKKHKAAGYDIEKLYEKVTIQLNDTHPVISIPELIRILVDNEGLSFEKALKIDKKTFNYTNHTVMAEAMEKWGLDIVKEVLPEIYDIIRSTPSPIYLRHRVLHAFPDRRSGHLGYRY